MDNFEIVVEIKAPTSKQMTQQKYLLRHNMISQEAQNFRLALLRILEDRLDFSHLESKESLLIKFSRTGNHKVDYSSVKNRDVRTHIRRVIESSYPIVC